ncbi:MAG: type IV secretory system conjugative DNA transfer family protein, partial [Bacilli bacterium]
FIINIKASFKDIREGQKGTSRFTTEEEIKEQYKEVDEVESRIEKENGGYEGKGGVIISRTGNKLFIDDSPVNNLIIGTTRSGKGELFVFPTIDLYSRAYIKSSLIINDPKGELYGASKDTLEARGYRVEVLNLLNPMNSMSYNPLQLIIDAYEKGEYSEAQSLCKTLTYTLYYKAGTKDPFWQTSAMSLVNALILAVIDKCFKECEQLKTTLKSVEDGNSENKEKIIAKINKKIDKTKSKMTLYSVANMLSELGSKEDAMEKNELDKYFENLDADSVAKMQYATSNFSKGATRGGIFSTAMSELQIFTMDELAKMTSKNSINLRSIGFKSDEDRPVALFMVTPDYDVSNHVIASIFVRQLYYILAKEASLSDSQKCDREVIFLLDEFGNMPAIEGMSNIVTVCLGRNIRFNLVIQAISQLKKSYGDDYNTILGNCSNKFYIFTNDSETSEEFSKLLGDETIVSYSRSGEVFDTTKHQTESVDGKRILNANELMRLEEGEIVIVRGTKRRDLKGNKIRPNPIFNREENTLKYRYEYLGKFFDNTKNLLNVKIKTLHEDVELKELLLIFNNNKENDEDNSKESEKSEENEKINQLNNMEIGKIFEIDEIYEINKVVDMYVNNPIKIDPSTKWIIFRNIAENNKNEELKLYLKKGIKKLEE